MMYASGRSDRSRPGVRSVAGWEGEQAADYHLQKQQPQQQPLPQQQQEQQRQRQRQGQRDVCVRASGIGGRAHANARLLAAVGTLALLAATSVMAVGGVSLTGPDTASVQISGASAASTRWTKATETGSDHRRVLRSLQKPGPKQTSLASPEEAQEL
uniref:Uncharacterized protein n=1 Tax=Anopheles melas TaxID=34690 RepID=A0A182TXS5_9DIPT